MYLKSIEINGFKSFANKTIFEFPQGITGIVGPNGSGKSNIADAVRWVLGEQSARQLRGARMEDVIFSGTQNRRAMGFAYVAITFENRNRMISLDYEEVTVARRVYRSGESEYLINGSTCRRRDIVELFYDTGIGKEGYSIIGQGQVEKILSGKIEDSRELFDEAAGIAKYKKNRAVTEKSLEQERQNLERVTDILSELEKQVEPLARQSEKAKEFLKIRDEEKELDLHLFLYDYQRLKDEQKEKTEQQRILAADLAGSRSACSSIKEKNAIFQKKNQQMAEKLEKEEAEREELQKQKTENNHQILILSNKMDSNLLFMEHYAKSEEKDQEKERELSEKLQKLNQTESEKKNFLQKAQQEFGQLQEASLKKKQEQELCEKEITVENDRRFSLINSSSGTREKLGRYKAMEEQLEIRNAEYNRRYLSFDSERKRYNEAVEALLKQQEKEKEAYEAQRGIVEELTQKSRECQEKEEQCQEKIRRLHQEFLQTKSRYETLLAVTERYDGYHQSIRHIMEQRKNHPGIIGVVADILTLPKKYETAIEIALGGALQNIVTEDNESAKTMIRFLKKNRLGRATFLPLTNIRQSNSAISPAILEEEGVIGIASSLVTVEERFQALIRSLLGRTIVVDTMDHALLLSRKNHFRLRLVTLDGELLNPGGAITGGAFRHAGNLLGRKRETRECEAALASIQADVKAKEETKQGIQKEKGQLILEETKQREVLEESRLTLHDLENQIPEMEKKRAELKEKIRSLTEEHQSLKNQMEEIHRQKQELLKEQEDNEQIHEENDTALDSLKQKLSVIKEELLGLEEKKNEKQLSIAACQQELDFLQNERTRLENERESLRESRENNKKEHAKRREENRSYQKEKEVLAQQESAFSKQIESISARLDAFKNERADLVQKQSQIFQELENENEKLLSLEKEDSRLTSRLERIKEELENRIDFMWENYEITYSQALEQKKYDIRLSNVPKYRERKKELQKQQKALGNVNVNAIAEYKEVGQRYEFLKKQYDDIKEAEAKLVAMIGELNTAMKEQFTREFGNIQTMFSQVFQNLFEGGTASLELMDQENVLESGIRIIAQPPGKKLQNILLLSGGERALTAIALLFAIQNLKPSPFCLLDEIEAALDDANITRFSNYLKKLTKDTQFIIITHRRGTMAAADALYGITMQEKGISTLISVDFIEKDLT